MAITTKATLLAACADALNRSDFTTQIASSLPLAEAWLNRNLRLRLMESDEALTGVVGLATIALPTGFLEPLSLVLNDTSAKCPIPMRATGLATYTGSGRPRSYVIDGANLVFDRPCDSAYSLTLHMLKRFALAEDDDTNALLDAWPDLYLTALLVTVAGLYLTDDPRLSAWKFTRDEILGEVSRKEARAKAPAQLRADASFLGRSCGPVDYLNA